jgi:hypothetical protein
LKTTPSVASLNESIYQLEKEVKKMEAQLSVLEAGATKPVDPVEKAKADKEYKRIEGQYLKRQKQFKLFWGTLLDAMEGDPRELWVSDISFLILRGYLEVFLEVVMRYLRTGYYSGPGHPERCLVVIMHPRWSQTTGDRCTRHS